MSVINRIAYVFISLLIVNCGGGSGGGDPGGDPSGAISERSGVFVDAVVTGLRYVSPSYEGVTDENGVFQYKSGEEVTFSVGDIVVGRALGADIVTPLDLVSGATDETDPHVTNIIRFLQSLDFDGDLTNGIVIPARIHRLLTGQSLDFSVTIADFEAAFNIVSDSVLGGIRLVAVDTARTHFRNTLDRISRGGYTGNNIYGGVTLAGADVDKIGSIYEPEIVSAYQTDISLSVSWTAGNSRPENVGRLAGIAVTRIGGNLQQLQLSVQDYRNNPELISYIYLIQCYPIQAQDCAKIELDEANKRLTLNGVTLQPTDSVVATNSATGPIVMSGVLFWE